MSPAPLFIVLVRLQTTTRAPWPKTHVFRYQRQVTVDRSTAKMACSYARSLVSSASKVLKMSTRTFARSRSCVLQNCMGVNPWLQRGFTRSHWVLCGEKQIPGAVNVGMNTTCSCSRLHTEGEEENTYKKNAQILFIYRHL